MTATAFPWTFRTLRDAYAARAPLRYVVAGMFPLPSVSAVYGAPGSLKSMLLADLAACVCSGRPWLAPMPGTGGTLQGLPTLAGPVAWIDLDNGVRRCDDRFEAFGRAYVLREDAPLHYVSMPPGGLQLDNMRHAESLALTIMQLGASLLILDNLSYVKGAADELRDMTSVMSNLRWVAEWSSCAVIAVHHQRKSNGFKNREGETLRGHSSIEAGLDLALLVDRGDATSLTVDVRATKSRGATFVERGASFAFTWKPNTQELATAKFFGTEASTRNNPKAQEANDIQEAILDALKTGPLNMSQLAAATSYTRRKLRPVLDKLRNSAMISEQPGLKTNERVFTI